MSAPLQGARWKIVLDPPTPPANGVQYICFAEPNTNTADAEWAIMRLTYVSSDVSRVEWARGTNRFVNICDDRATYSYS